MPSNDIRLPGWDLPASAGVTYELVFSSNLALTSLAIWLGGTLDSAIDLTGATANNAVLSGANLVATVTLEIPEGEAIPMRLAVNGAVATVGYLRPSTAGAKQWTSRTLSLRLDDSLNIDLAIPSIVVGEGGGGGGTDDQTAAEVPFTPTGGLASTNVQSALAELDTEKSSTAHNHDGTYSPAAHNHDASYASTAHLHDDRYYTETEVDTALAGKSDTGHNHSGTYDPAGTASAAVAAHEAAVDPHPTYLTAAEGNAAYATAGHNHDASYEAAGAVAAHEADTLGVHGIADTSALLDNADIGTTVQAHSAVLSATTASFTTADETKLDGIAAGATDDTTVNAHIADGTDAHDASAISIADAGALYTATNVEDALAEVKQVADAAGGGGVTLEQVQDDLGTTSLVAGTSLTKTYDDVAGTITLDVDSADFATAAQGALADSATQPADLATVATTGAYADLTGKPVLGTAAAEDTTAFDAAGSAAAAQTAANTYTDGEVAGLSTVYVAQAGSAQTLWLGTEAAYAAIATPDANTVYVVTSNP